MPVSQVSTQETNKCPGILIPLGLAVRLGISEEAGEEQQQHGSERRTEPEFWQCSQ